MKNKNGQVEIAVFIFLIVGLVFFSIYTFYANPKKVEANIYDARFLEVSYSEKEIMEIYIEKVGKDVIKGGVNGFEERFKTEFARYNFTESYLNDLKKLVSEGDFKVSQTSEFLEIIFENLDLKNSLGEISVTYTPKISVGFDLKN